VLLTARLRCVQKPIYFLEAQKVREQLEKEQEAREDKERELRAEMIKFMYEDIYFEKGSYRLAPDTRELLQRNGKLLKPLITH
jgi:outer membrane protein OmpA-like peptidoglycan-associated protein